MAAKIKNKNSAIKIQLAQELRIWLSQSKHESQSQFSREIGISHSNVKKYFQGRRLPAGENLLKLQEATNLEILNQLPKSSRTKKKSKKRLPVKTQIATPISPDLANEKAKGVWKTLVSLNNELEFFKRGSPNDRKVFRDIISGEDVGYIIALLKALFNEDQFQNWIYFTKYEMGGEKNEG